MTFYNAILSLDIELLLFMQENIRCALLDPVMKAASWVGDVGMIWIAAAVIMLIFKKTRRSGFDLALCLAIAAIICNLAFKNIVQRPRPFLTVSELELIVAPLSSFSFPSGHACSSFASATAIALGQRKYGGWAFLPATLIAFSRVYVGVHYPSDVLTGAVLGFLMSLLVYWLSHRLLVFPYTKK